MVYEKAKVHYNKYYPRKDRRVDLLGMRYKMYFHYTNNRLLKYYRRHANRKLRRHQGDVGDHGWYKRFEEVWYNVY